MRILITGANGLLGQKLIALLQMQADVHTIATARGPLRLAGTFDRFDYAELDITIQNDVEAAMAKWRPDVVVNTAAMTQVDQCETDKEACRALNVDAVQYLADACAAHNAQLIHLGTDFIFDGLAGPYSETDEPNPLSFYGQSKLDADKIVMHNKGKWAIARTILVYGLAADMSRSNIILWVKSSLEAGKKIQVVNDQYRTPTLAEDLAMGCWLIAKHGAQGIYNIGGPELLTPYQMAMQTAEYFGLDASLIEMTDGSKFSQPAKRPARTGLVIEKARKELGYAPKTFKEGMALLAEQMMAKP